MAENIRKRRQISVKEKLDILSMIDSGNKLSAVARQFGISTSTASTIVKERFKIKLLSEYYNISPDRKRMRLGLFKDVDEAVHIWFRQMRTKNYHVNGPLLQQKAREFALHLGHRNFEGSSGWLFRFRERFGLSVKDIKDEDGSNVVSGIGMTDDEIIASVCHNTFHSVMGSDTTLSSEYYYNSSSSKSLSDTHILNTNDISDPAEVHDNTKAIIKENLKSEVYDSEGAAQENLEFSSSETTISLKDAVALVTKLTTFLKQQDSVPTHVWNSMNVVSGFIVLDLSEQLKQRKITEYFKP